MASCLPQTMRVGTPSARYARSEHRDHLALPVDARAQGAQDGPPGLGVGQRVEHGEDLLGIATERRIEHAEEPGTDAARHPDGRESEQRHQDLDAGNGSEAEQRAHRAPDPPAAHQHQALAALGELVGELRRHPAAERVAHHGGSLDLQDGQEVAHPVGEAGDGVVGPRLLRAPVAEQVRRNHRVVLGQLLDHRAPGVRAVTDAVDEEHGRAACRPSRRRGDSRGWWRSAR